MPRPHPPEFRMRAVELARERAKPIADLARDLGVSESCLRNWMAKADIEEGRREGVTAADRRVGEGIRGSRKRVERLMRQGQIVGLHKRRKKGTTRRDPAASPSEDLVNRVFDVDAPNRLWVTDIERHEALLNLAVVKGH